MTTRAYSEDVAELTPRMLAVLRAAARGLTSAQTAQELGCAAETVRSIRAAAIARTGAHNVTQAVWQARARL